MAADIKDLSTNLSNINTALEIAMLTIPNILTKVLLLVKVKMIILL